MDTNKTKTNIKNTYLLMINDNPDKRIKVIELCRLAEINRSTFYSYYYDIYQVMEEINDEIKGEMIAILQNEITKQKDLTHTFYRVLEVIKLNRNFFLYYLINNKAVGNLNILDDDVIKKQIHNLRSNGMQTENDFDYNYEFFNGGMAAIIRLWITKKCADPIDDVVKILIEKLNGFSN
ncbi:hypothetical protein R4B61_01695 [Fructilactobacillus vespulae]|uniref:TetR/AcrR family transcriptional regulator C-terminal domain-containing protein n=1 Tax=Fructilactobacillus vespulae TaxID=1249630 RepID=UPI0039B375A6